MDLSEQQRLRQLPLPSYHFLYHAVASHFHHYLAPSLSRTNCRRLPQLLADAEIVLTIILHVVLVVGPFSFSVTSLNTTRSLVILEHWHKKIIFRNHDPLTGHVKCCIIVRPSTCCLICKIQMCRNWFQLSHNREKKVFESSIWRAHLPRGDAFIISRCYCENVGRLVCSVFVIKVGWHLSIGLGQMFF